MGSGVKYSQDLRADVVREVVEFSRPVRDVAERAGVKPDTLRTWIHRARKEGLAVADKKTFVRGTRSRKCGASQRKQGADQSACYREETGRIFGKSCELFRGGELQSRDWFEVIVATEKQNLGVSVRFMCATAEVSASGYRRWRDEPSAVDVRHDSLAGDIETVWRDSGCTYGSDRVHAELVRAGKARCCERTVRKIMARKGWPSVHPQPWRHTTQTDGTPPAQDLIGRDFTADRPGVRLVGDITQIDTWEGTIFLATVIDLYSREIVGYAIDDNYKADLVCAAVVMAGQNRRIRRKAVFHSGHGSEYTSKTFRKCLKVNGRIRPSMGAVGCAYDNSVAESFFAMLKKECVYPTMFATRRQATETIGDYIERFYNTRRLHTSVGYRPPTEARKEYKTGQSDSNQRASN